MTIKNPMLVKLLKKLLRLKTYKVEFIYEKEIYDKDLTELAFLNTARREFDEQSKEFIEDLDKAIEEASSPRRSG